MSAIHAVSASTHKDKTWKHPGSYTFASKDNVVVLGWQEVRQAAMYLPLAVMKHEDKFQLVAVMALTRDENLLVGPHGEWLMEYVPTKYRCAPFRLAQNKEGNYVLCIDDGLNLVGNSREGKPFVTDENQLTEEVKGIGELMVRLENERNQISSLGTYLDSVGLIEPWPLQIKAGANEWQIDGLFRIDEKKLNELPAEQLLEVRDKGGLTLCYAQLLSMQHVQRLARIAHTRASAAQPARSPQSALSFSDNGGVISFDNL